MKQKMKHLCDDCITNCNEKHGGIFIISCKRYKGFMEDYNELKDRVKKLEEIIDGLPTM